METFQDAVGQFDFQAVVRSTVDFQASRKRPHPATQYVGPGDSIAADPDVLRGHGTFLANERLVGAVSGVVERVDKLITAQPLKARYSGDVGDVVVGRITQVLPKRWKVDINSTVSAGMMLGGIILPDGALRRRTHDDELAMRSFYAENDLISAEVQEFKQDRSVMLHTRSTKYGKLKHGMLVAVPSHLIKRLKHHFHKLPCGVNVILGCNGYVWVAPPAAHDDDDAVPTIHHLALAATSKHGEDGTGRDVPVAVREAVCRVRNSIVALATCNLMIYPATIMDAFQASLDAGLGPSEILGGADRLQQLTMRAASRCIGTG